MDRRNGRDTSGKCTEVKLGHYLHKIFPRRSKWKCLSKTTFEVAKGEIRTFSLGRWQDCESNWSLQKTKRANVQIACSWYQWRVGDLGQSWEAGEYAVVWWDWGLMNQQCYFQGHKVMTSTTPFAHNRRRSRAISQRSQASGKVDNEQTPQYDPEPADDSGISDLSEGQALFASMRTGYQVGYHADQPESYYRTEYSNGWW